MFEQGALSGHFALQHTRMCAQQPNLQTQSQTRSDASQGYVCNGYSLSARLELPYGTDALKPFSIQLVRPRDRGRWCRHVHRPATPTMAAAPTHGARFQAPANRRSSDGHIKITDYVSDTSTQVGTSGGTGCSVIVSEGQGFGRNGMQSPRNKTRNHALASMKSPEN